MKEYNCELCGDDIYIYTSKKCAGRKFCKNSHKFKFYSLLNMAKSKLWVIEEIRVCGYFGGCPTIDYLLKKDVIVSISEDVYRLTGFGERLYKAMVNK